MTPAATASQPRSRAPCIERDTPATRHRAAASRRRRVTSALLAVTLVAALPPATPAQSATQRLRAQRDSLDRIQRERRALEHQMTALKGRAHSIAEEASNLEGQAQATARMVRGLDIRLADVIEEINGTTIQLVMAQDELAIKRATLQRRLVDIYKRGPLFSLEVMLSAESFGELIARYKYLHELARRDQALVARVRDLAGQISRQRRELIDLQSDVTETRDQRAREEATYRRLRSDALASLRRIERDASEAERRLAAVARDEARVTEILTALEADRRRAAATSPAPAATPRSGGGTFRTGANLAWPVDGEIIYPFGRAAGPDRTITSWTGMGIGAPAGTPVRAIAAGVVKLVERHLGTYGATVMILHPTGEYSVYSSLGSITVAKDAIVDRGQQIGTVGVNDPRLGPHLHFEIRTGTTTPIPVDPLPFLRPRR